MIKHIVLFSVKNSSDKNTIISALSEYKNIPEVLNFNLKENLKLDSVSQEIDIVLMCDFKSKEELNRYKENKLYIDTIDIVKPLRDTRIVVDIEVEEDTL